jgi:hypothetical protein
MGYSVKFNSKSNLLGWGWEGNRNEAAVKVVTLHSSIIGMLLATENLFNTKSSRPRYHCSLHCGGLDQSRMHDIDRR